MEKMNKLKIISYTVQSLVFLLLFSAVFVLITSKTALVKGIRSFVVVSGSMQPAIKVGSIVITQPGGSYQTGDVIAFDNKAQQTVTHRIVETVNSEDGLSYRLKGDANQIADGDLVSQKDVVGKVIFTLPYFGRFVQFLRTPPGFIGLIIVPSLLFIIWEIFNIKKEMEKQIEAKFLNRYHRLNSS